MKHLLACLIAAAASAPGAAMAAYDEEGLSEAFTSSDTARLPEEEDGLAQVQESDEDLSSFVMDYIRRDILLKGSFLFEDKAAGKVLKLELLSVENTARNAEGGNKTVTAVFGVKPSARYTLVFHLRPVAWGGVDIFRIELKKPPPAAAKKKE